MTHISSPLKYYMNFISARENNICRDAGNEGDGSRHGGEGREWLRTNRIIFAEMPGMKEMAHGMVEKGGNV